MGLLEMIRDSALMGGLARMMDFGGVLAERQPDEGLQGDMRNLRRDWEEVGGYMRAAVNQVTSERKKP